MMAQLHIFLPPFAADYSGACTTLWDLDCLTVINDASCCTSHYVFYDEPRWADKVKPVFCTTLRNVDAILGTDDKVIAQVCQVEQEINALLIALIGTPVPALVGMDTVGMACEVEARCGKPAFGFDTTGFSYYDKGIAMAGKALFKRFSREVAPREVVPERVNILGMTPLDYGNVGNELALESALQNAGYEVECRAFMGLTIAQLREAGTAQLNLAVSAAGVVLAKNLERRFGTPWTARLPEGVMISEELISSVNETIAGKRNALIVGDQIIANMLRAALHNAGFSGKIQVASFFGWDTTLAEQGDAALKDEAAFLRLMHDNVFDALIADPLICDTPPAKNCACVKMVHPAVSSKLYWVNSPRYFQ